MLEDSRQYYLPLSLRADGILAPTQAAELRGADLPLVEDLQDYISKNYSSEVGYIDIRGRRYEGAVLRPFDSQDHWYILVDDFHRTIHGKTCDRDLTQSELAELDPGAYPINHSEALAPQESISIPDSFIEPEFEDLENEKEISTKMSWSTLSQAPRVVIVGAPGAGKTTALRRLAHFHLENWHRDHKNLFPIYVQMRHLHDGGGIEQVVRSNLELHDPEFSANTSLALSDQRVILILDGLDEIPDSNRDDVIDAVVNLSRRNASLGIVISTREFGYRWKLPSFRHVRIMPLSSAKIREWSYYRFGLEGRPAWRGFINSLEERQNLHELAGNPLFLSLAVGLYRRNSALPQSRASLLKSYIFAMTEHWDSVRGVVRQRDAWAAPQRKLAALCHVAYLTRVASRENFTNVEFETWNESLEVERSLLPACQRDTGIVRQINSEFWTFTHRTFADFLAAQFIVEHTGNSERHLEPLVKTGNWLDIWAYSCGLSQNATELVQFLLGARNISRPRKIDALAAAFEQDIFVSPLVASRSASFIEREALHILENAQLKKQRQASSQDTTWHLISISSEIDATHIESVLRALGRLRKSKMGLQLAERLRRVKNDLRKAMAELLESDSLAQISRAENKKTLTITVNFADELKDINSTTHIKS